MATNRITYDCDECGVSHPITLLNLTVNGKRRVVCVSCGRKLQGLPATPDWRTTPRQFPRG